MTNKLRENAGTIAFWAIVGLAVLYWRTRPPSPEDLAKRHVEEVKLAQYSLRQAKAHAACALIEVREAKHDLEVALEENAEAKAKLGPFQAPANLQRVCDEEEDESDLRDPPDPAF